MNYKKKKINSNNLRKNNKVNSKNIINETQNKEKKKEDKLLKEIYQLVDEINEKIKENIVQTQEQDKILYKLKKQKKELEKKTESITMNINKPNIDNQSSGLDDPITLTTGSQLYPGTFLTADSLASRTSAYERNLNRNLRRQRYNQMLNSLRIRNRQHISRQSNNTSLSRISNPLPRPSIPSSRQINTTRQEVALAA